jgi:predicted  nucleic acid-binding Zn-ribbon protein
MAEITKKDIFNALSEFYGKVIEPRFDRIEMRLDEHDQKFRDILNHFDEVYKTEYYSILAAIDRMEKRFDQVEGRLDKIEVQLDGIGQKLDKEISIREIIEKEIKDLKQRVSTLQERIEDLERRLKSFS